MPESYENIEIMYSSGHENKKVCFNPHTDSAEEIKIILSINKQMIKYNGLFYILDFRCFSTKQFFDALHNNQIENLYSGRIFPLLTNPTYRAEQFLLYRQLPIFHPILPLIEEAIKSYFATNYIVAYFSLVPAVEGLLRRWHGNPYDEINPIAFVNRKTAELKNTLRESHENALNWQGHNLELLKYSIKNFFARPNNNETSHKFNRNIISHLLDMPNIMNAQENCLKLLSIIDLIAKCYTYEHPLPGGGRIEMGSSCIFCAKYLEEGQPEIQKLRQEFISCIPRL